MVGTMQHILKIGYLFAFFSMHVRADAAMAHVLRRHRERDMSPKKTTANAYGLPCVSQRRVVKIKQPANACGIPIMEDYCKKAPYSKTCLPVAGILKLECELV